MNAPISSSTLADLQRTPPLATSREMVTAGFFSSQGFELLQRVAKAFASSSLVPKQYQNNVANCMIALNLARRLQADELMVMQNLYIVNGNPGWSAKFLIACVNTCGRFTAMRYEWKGTAGTDDFGCRAWAIERETGERLNGVWIDWAMVKAEGWHSKAGSKWKTMPDQMFVYRAAAFWQRAYAPEISMGLSSAEELADVVDFNPDGSFTVTTESLSAGMKTVEAEVQKQAESVDQSTGEITREPTDDAPSNEGEKAEVKQSGASPIFTLAQVQEAFNKAKTLDELNDAALMIDAIGNRAHKKEANEAYKKRVAEIEFDTN